MRYLLFLAFFFFMAVAVFGQYGTCHFAETGQRVPCPPPDEEIEEEDDEEVITEERKETRTRVYQSGRVGMNGRWVTGNYNIGFERMTVTVRTTQSVIGGVRAPTVQVYQNYVPPQQNWRQVRPVQPRARYVLFQQCQCYRLVYY